MTAQFPATGDPSMTGRLRQNQNGAVLNTIDNACIVLESDPRFTLRRNLLGHVVELNGEELPDAWGTVEAVRYLERAQNIRLPLASVAAVIHSVASRNAYYPPEEYLNRLQWDREPWIDRLARAVGCENNPIYRRFVRCSVLAAAARALHPGCPVDAMLVLVGPQRIGKSSFFRELCGASWFSDTPIVIGQKDSYMQLSRAWIYEMSEMRSVTRADDESARAFVTSPSDTYRIPYGRSAQQYPRRGILGGTLNRRQFLTDPAGSRRFHPVEVTCRIDIDRICAHRDLIWAEAAYAIRAGEDWRLSPNEESAREDAAEMYHVTDDWEGPILSAAVRLAEACEARGGVVRSIDIVRSTFGWAQAWQTEKLDRRTSLRVADILHRRGWEQDAWGKSPDGFTQRGWKLVNPRKMLRAVDDEAAAT